jgi:hypothetical protein
MASESSQIYSDTPNVIAETRSGQYEPAASLSEWAATTIATGTGGNGSAEVDFPSSQDGWFLAIRAVRRFQSLWLSIDNAERCR